MKTYVSLFGMVFGLGNMLLGGVGALIASMNGDFIGYSMSEISLTFVAGFIILIASIYAFPQDEPEEEKEVVIVEKEVIPEMYQ